MPFDYRALLLERYGPLLGGADLYQALGFTSPASFRRAVRLKQIEVRLISVPGRRGKFALTTEVADWLEALAKAAEPARQEDTKGRKTR
ncbi:hypothetical protein [Chromobacterium violaceum]|uniref:hypothetical protein n=1 Tax=Chromobacterium violaceum TaxID=536 RepID=UPI00096BFFB1|nr:hypothetical protein [Chromobacterium violaceum]OLZ76583.1 hypothetical protein BS642_16095 [Chromobacterium violaceum]